MENWQTDITTLVAVQSLFEGSTRDPWAENLAGKLADWYAYGITPTYVLPMPLDRADSQTVAPVPSIVPSLRQHESTAMRPRVFETGDPFILRDELYERTLISFLAWCRVNPSRLRQWLTLHCEDWATVGYSSRIPGRYLYDVRRVFADPSFREVSGELHSSVDDLAYALDVALRYARYGEFAGPGGIYLSHPIREQQMLPTMTLDPQRLPTVAVSFAESVSKIAGSLTLDAYSALLHEIRGVVEAHHLREVKAGTLEPRLLRQMATELNLPAKLRGWAKATGAGATLLGGIAALPTLGPHASVAATVVGMGGIFLTGSVPRSVSRFKWTRWALESDIERQGASTVER